MSMVWMRPLGAPFARGLTGFGHTFGVKVDRPLARRLWPPDGGGLCSLRSGGDSPDGLRVVDCRSAAMLIKSALRDLLFCVIGHEKHYGNQPPPVASPPFGALRHHLPPAERWDNKALKGSLLICDSTVSTGYSAPACGGKVEAPATKGGGISNARRAVVKVFAAKGGIKNGDRKGAILSQRSDTI